MAALVPAVLFSYLTLFKPHFTKPSFAYFSGYTVSLLLTGGRKTMNRVADACFWVDRHLASWERFLAENRWDPIAIFDTLLETLKTKLGEDLPVQTVSVHLYGKLITVKAVCREVWLRDIAHKVKVVVIEGIKEPIILISTNLALAIAQIIEIYGACFTIEIAGHDRIDSVAQVLALNQRAACLKSTKR